MSVSDRIGGAAAGAAFRVASRAAAAVLRRLPPEAAHDLAVRGLMHGPARRSTLPPLDGLGCEIAGLRFSHPVCLGAGFDKHAQAMAGLLALGFAGVEVGSVTLRPQAGNPRPRVFRLPERRAIINRYGFNSAGAEAVGRRLARYDGGGTREGGAGGGARGVVGASLGLNKGSTDPAGDYAGVAERLGPHADYLAFNPSSPNTAGLRRLQAPEQLGRIVRAVAGASPRPLFVKLSPDMERGEEAEVFAALAELPVAAAIVSNTTLAREGVAGPHGGLHAGPHAGGAGGLSGPPLAERARAMLVRARAALPARIALVASGGIETGSDVADRLALGASLVQVYTAFIYRGPDTAARMVEELIAARAGAEPGAEAEARVEARAEAVENRPDA